MPSEFDAYYKWLGIPPRDQPPHHYQLLGIPPFESDREVIRNAADQKMTYLRSFGTGPHSPISQKLLNEVSEARTCLLNAERKRDYDAQLRVKLSISVPPRIPRRTSRDTWIAIGLTAVLFGVIGGGIYWFPGEGNDESRPDEKCFLVLEWPAGQRNGATVSISGHVKEMEEAVLTDDERIAFALKGGKHLVRIEREGFEPFTEIVELADGGRVTLIPTFSVDLFPFINASLNGQWLPGGTKYEEPSDLPLVDDNPKQDTIDPTVEELMNPGMPEIPIYPPSNSTSALSGREQGMKQTLLSRYGGTAVTEAAVELGLEWLERNQRSGGYWSMLAPYADGATTGLENRVAATAMALLAFQGAGHTHERGPHQTVVERGRDYLLRQLDKSGSFYHDNDDQQRLYSQAQATIALCELYGMTRDEKLRAPAQRTIDYAVRNQDSLGGWRYRPGEDSDTSVTGWFMAAFQTAMVAGLAVPEPVLQRISDYLDKVDSHDGSRYAYRPGREATIAMTAEALLCRQYLGWKRDDLRFRDGVEYIRANPINYRDKNVYYWYYASQLLHHMGGDAWEEWNSQMREVVPENQTKTGKERGSWTPVGDRWGDHYAGRLYTTCLSIYMLEVYYRHLSIHESR